MRGVNSTSRRILVGLLILGSFGSRLVAAPGDLVSAEWSFAEAVAREGIGPAFSRFLSGQAILLRPHPVRVGDYLASQPEDPGRLDWTPAWVLRSRAEDMGVTTGPWRYRANRTNATVSAAGEYVTVWHRTEAGWRVMFDGGVGAPAVAFPSRVEIGGAGEAGGGRDAAAAEADRRELRLKEEAYGRLGSREGEAAALKAHARPDVRVLRSGVNSVTGRADGVRLLANNGRKTRDRLDGLYVSANGDFGWAWGESELLGSGPVPPQPVRAWLRVWTRRDPDATWRIALDFAADYPPKSPAPP